MPLCQERGQARLPDPEIPGLLDFWHVERPSWLRSRVNFNQLRVGKAGLPPLLCP
jgi:hypothetical protein